MKVTVKAIKKFYFILETFKNLVVARCIALTYIAPNVYIF